MLPRYERISDLSEEAFLPNLGEGDVEDLVSGRHLFHGAKLAIRKSLLQLCHYVIRLDQGQLQQ